MIYIDKCDRSLRILYSASRNRPSVPVAIVAHGRNTGLTARNAMRIARDIARMAAPLCKRPRSVRLTS